MRPTESARPRRNSANAGFTLIETLAALAIAGALFAVIAEFAGRTLRNWNHGEATIAVMEMLTRGLGRMQVDLNSAVPMTPPGTDGSTVYFAGNANAMRFVAATGFGVGNHGLELLNISAKQDNDDLLLVRERGPILNPASQLSDPVVLMRGHIQVRFAYRDAGGQTFDQWGNKPELPAAVLVKVLAQDGTPVFPSAFVLPVPVNLGADCLVDQGDATPPRCNGTQGNNQGQNNGQDNGQPQQPPNTPQEPQ
ncbi:MAG TPA: prepilin-type N-terminal cleavage/methylation domain-containing protein [Pseudolabrys sp.]|nr:prepilin-type N-terminal cleavage/methylation domain-containing protein [Pseudolabrys sp.]